MDTDRDAVDSGAFDKDTAMLRYYDRAVNNARIAGVQVLLLIDGGP